jgi:uncharacterized protein (DUF1501 family)
MAMNDDESSRAGMGRRSLLRRVLFAGGATVLGAGGLGGTLAQLARGNDHAVEDRFYVFAYFSGGWDVLLGIDPRDPATFDADSVGATRIQPGYEQQAAAQFQARPALVPGTDILLGPVARPLDVAADRLAIVRGMTMETLTHEVGRRRFLTGKPPAGLQARGSAGSAWLAGQFDGSLIPNLSVRVESFNPDLPNDLSALRVGSASDLVAILRRADPVLDPEVEAAIASLHEQEAECPRSLGSPVLRASESARRRMRAVLDADVQALFNFVRNPADITDPTLRAKMELLHEHFALAGASGSSPREQAAIAAQALTNGVARVVTIQAASGLDTHFDDWRDEQAQNQLEGFEAIASLVRYLRAVPYGTTGESMLDRTVIVGFSEFMRTPLLNARGGRDHWLTNSCFLIGGNVRGGTVIGASSDTGMQPQAVDLSTGRVVEDPRAGEVIRPEHIWRTLLVDAGMDEDRADLRVGTIPALMRS